MAHLQPYFTEVQAHYDLSNEFFALFLDPSMTYSCAFFKREEMTLEEAQVAKIDLTLDKCDLRPGTRLLDIGCGWGSTARTAAERFNVHVTGLTLSRNQHAHARRLVASLPGGVGERIDIRLQGWEEFEERVDRIVSIGAFEHFRAERHHEFFARSRAILPDDGRMLLHSIVDVDPSRWHTPERPSREDVDFARFMRSRIFPGTQLSTAAGVVSQAERAGFRVGRMHSLQPHYARTLEIWAASLRANRDEAIRLTSDETYDTYTRYLSGCGKYFLNGRMDVVQFTCECA